MKHLAQEDQVVTAADVVKVKIAALKRDVLHARLPDHIVGDLDGVGKVEQNDLDPPLRERDAVGPGPAAQVQGRFTPRRSMALSTFAARSTALLCMARMNTSWCLPPERFGIPVLTTSSRPDQFFQSVSR